jgi:hypothetical protein
MIKQENAEFKEVYGFVGSKRTLLFAQIQKAATDHPGSVRDTSK